MAVVKPFICIRPSKEAIREVASLPYDVYSRDEARAAVCGKPHAFLNIDRPETAFAPDVDMYADAIYEKGRELFAKEIKAGIYIKDTQKKFYVYELTMDGRIQTGIVGLASVDEYLSGAIKKHENTRKEKELDRIRHVSTLQAHTGPIFLAYKPNTDLKDCIANAKNQKALYDFVADDGIRHTVWEVVGSINMDMVDAFKSVDTLYIADGHHRAASAVAVACEERKKNPNFTGEEEYNFFLSVLFDADELKIMPYNRVVRDLNGYSDEAFLSEVEKLYTITKLDIAPESVDKKGDVAMYIHTEVEEKTGWYLLSQKNSRGNFEDPVKRLDVSILQDTILDKLLGIKDSRTDERIYFIGGIRGAGELSRMVDSGVYKVAFLMHPTSIEELFAVADANALMPPKSTWFEPKLRSGIFIHEI